MNASPACSISSPPSARPSRTWFEAVPTIVAESLHTVETVPPLLPRDRGSPRDVAAALARAALTPEAGVPPPAWLLPRQRRSHARLVAALRRFGGALLADPVGTGKTYIALAVARSLGGRATCIVPATLVSRWREISARLDVPAVVSSHERASRGTLPRANGLVVVDESHHYRNRETRRYGHLARWLVGRTTLLLSATPVVNRLADLSAQLLLVLPDDALAPLGVPSLAVLPERDSFPAAVSLVVQTDGSAEARPRARARAFRPAASVPDLVSDLDSLALSSSTPVARLVRGVLLRAAASSPAALDASLRRYRLLLLQARDAVSAGVRPDRASLRRWAGELPDQTVLWQLIGDGDGSGELMLDDLPLLDDLIRRADALAERNDPKAARLADLVADGARTLVFSSSRDTTLWLRRWIDPPPAWCTGDAAGIGHTRLPRELVLKGFAPDAHGQSSRVPHVLLATDVAAEGLDLQGAQRVVHYDLPWTPARLDQREGRARRLGGIHAEVEVVTFEPPPSVERELRQLRILAAKRELTARARLAGGPLERLQSVLEDAAAWTAAVPGVATASRHGDVGALVGLSLVELADLGGAWGTSLHWLPRAGSMSSAADTIASRLEAAASASADDAPDPTEVRWLEEAIAPLAADLLRAAQGSKYGAGADIAARRLIDRLSPIGRAAARRRDEPMLEAVDRAMRALSRGHTAGEMLLLRDLIGQPTRPILERLAALPERPARSFDVRVAGIVLFRPAPAPLP
jgi:hypothetical protein